MTPDYDPVRPDWRDDPYPAYRRLRDAAPVHFAPATNAYLVSRYDDVMAVLRSPDVFSSRAMFTYLMNGGREGPPPWSWRVVKLIARLVWHARMNPFGFATARNLVAEDGASHAAMRAIVNRGFTPRRIGDWEARVRAITAEHVAKLDGGTPFDLVQDLAIPLPVTVIAEMLGVEPSRLPDFKRWSDAIIANTTGPGRADPFNDAYVDAIVELMAYLREVVVARQRGPADDLVSVIASQQAGEDGLTTREVVQFVVLLLVAGNETTTNLIGNLVSALLEHPDQLARVAADPALVPAAIEETLRFDPPIQIVFRVATEDTEIAGTRIPRGSFVAPLLGSANRDERQFPDPDRFDVGRNPQAHVAFGFGKHFCLGAALARLEARVALEALLPALPKLERDGPKQLVDSFLVRGPRRLVLRRAEGLSRAAAS